MAPGDHSCEVATRLLTMLASGWMVAPTREPGSCFDAMGVTHLHDGGLGGEEVTENDRRLVPVV